MNYIPVRRLTKFPSLGEFYRVWPFNLSMRDFSFKGNKGTQKGTVWQIFTMISFTDDPQDFWRAVWKLEYTERHWKQLKDMRDLRSVQIQLNERGFKTDTKSPFLLESKTVKLYDYHDIPYFLRGNPYVTSGYRAFLSFRLCVKR